MKEGILTIDIGTSSIKAIVFDTEGNILAQSCHSYPISSTQKGWAEVCPHTIANTTWKTIQDCLANSNLSIQACSFTSQMHSLMGLDHKKQACTPLLLWLDNRASQEAQQIQSLENSSLWGKKTGCKVDHPMYPLAKILWFANQTDTFLQTKHWITIKEYILLQLCGRLVVDYATAAGQGFLDIHQLKWATDILAFLNISCKQLSSIVPSTTVLSIADHLLASKLGLPLKTPIIVGTSDGVAANIGTQTFLQDWTCTIGTSGAIRCNSPHPIATSNQSTWCYPYKKDFYVAGGAINNGGLVFQWLQEKFFPIGLSKKDLMIAASQAPIGSKNLIFLPHLTGERSPDWNYQQPGVIYGLTQQHTYREIIRSAMEGVLYRLYWIYQIFYQQGISRKAIVACGGYVHNKLWLQMQTDIFGKEIHILPNLHATSWGAALIAISALEKQDLSNKAPLSRKEIFYPNEENHHHYQKQYQLYKDTYNHIMQ